MMESTFTCLFLFLFLQGIDATRAEAGRQLGQQLRERR